MRRLIPAGILLIFVITIYSASHGYIMKICDEVKQMIDNCETAYKSQTEAVTAAEALEEYWDEKEKLLSFFVNHSLIDDIELSVSTLKVYSATEDNIIFYEYSDKLKILIHELTEETNFSVVNIF